MILLINKFKKTKNLKKLLLTIIIISLSYSNVIASTQGKVFLEIQQDCTVCAKKTIEKEIKSENVIQARLHDGTDVTDYVKKTLSSGDDLFFFENCNLEKNAHLEITYVFNLPPTINLQHPQDESVFDSDEVYFQWEGKDPDGKFMEYMLEVSEDSSFEDETYRSEWRIDSFYEESFEDGGYFWRVFVRDNSFLNNVVESETFSFNVDTFVREISKPIILDPEDGLKTRRKEGTLSVKTDVNVTNHIYLNDLLVEVTTESEFKIKIELDEEGEHTIRVVSKDGDIFAEESITIFANWTPPNDPVFGMKIEDEDILVKIEEGDFEKAYIYYDEKVVKETTKKDEWINLGSEFFGEIEIGVMLEDDFGNKTDIFYKVLEIDEDLLGTGSVSHDLNLPHIPNPSVCHYKYNITQKRFTARWCNITAPRIIRIEQRSEDGRSFTTRVAGVHNPDMLIIVDEYVCTLPIVCRERFARRTRRIMETYTSQSFLLNGEFKRSDHFNRVNKYFFIGTFLSNKDLRGTRVSTSHYVQKHFRYRGSWTPRLFRSPVSNTRVVPAVSNLTGSPSKKIFRFPFSRHIGVTQWHGYTAFQSPHTGIDFGSYREPVYAIGDGIIRAAQWDNYSGECLSGGYFVRIEHTNGMNSVYLHLENYRKSNGRNWRVGERIRKGDLVGISGNTGAYNCQPLGYHLHFELRKDRFQRNHVNPVPYIAVDWNRIPTLQHERFPGRLTGDNPHPTW